MIHNTLRLFPYSTLKRAGTALTRTDITTRTSSAFHFNNDLENYAKFSALIKFNESNLLYICGSWIRVEEY